MPRPMLKNMRQSDAKQDNFLTLTREKAKTNEKLKQNEKMQIDRILRQKRSKKYMEAMASLDAGGHTTNQQKVKMMIDLIQQEFPHVDVAGILLGVVSLCYLGAPYEVHSLDMGGDIIEHYKRGQTMPGGLEKARSIAIHGGYSFIEVYVDCCRAIGPDGEVSVIPG